MRRPRTSYVRRFHPPFPQPPRCVCVGLDPPLLLYFPRLCLRTLLRLLRMREPCSPGCDESVRAVFFSRDSILWWCLSQHWVSRRRNGALLRKIGVEVRGRAGDRPIMRRLGGWGSELRAWWGAVQAMVRERQDK